MSRSKISIRLWTVLLLSFGLGICYGIPLVTFAKHPTSTVSFQTLYLFPFTKETLCRSLDRLCVLFLWDAFLFACAIAPCIGMLSLLISFASGIAFALLLSLRHALPYLLYPAFSFYLLYVFAQILVSLRILTISNRFAYQLRLERTAVKSPLYSELFPALACYEQRIFYYFLFQIISYMIVYH